MGNEEQGMLLTLDPDARPGRQVRGGTARTSTPPQTDHVPATDSVPAEATLSLEPLRVPIIAMVRSTLRDEREVLERLGTDLHTELEHLREWREHENEMRADQTALYRRAAEEWDAAGRQATALQASSANLVAATHALQTTVVAAGARFWRRAMLAAWLVALTGLGLIGGLCGVVWLALTHR
jgi:hypothetical protein